MRKGCLLLVSSVTVLLAAGAAGTARADEPGYGRGQYGPRHHVHSARPKRVAYKHRHPRGDYFGYYGRGWGQTTRVIHPDGQQVVYEVYFPYVGRYYGAGPYLPRPIYTAEPTVSGLTAASLVTGLNDSYKMNRCYPPESIRHVGYFVVPVDRQQYYCPD